MLTRWPPVHGTGRAHGMNDRQPTNPTPTKEDAMTFTQRTARAEKTALMENALRVILHTPHISEYLAKNDPKALQQIIRALNDPNT